MSVETEVALDAGLAAVTLTVVLALVGALVARMWPCAVILVAILATGAIAFWWVRRREMAERRRKGVTL